MTQLTDAPDRTVTPADLTGAGAASDLMVAPDLTAVLTEIAAGATARDRVPQPEFPADAIAALQRAGALAFSAVPGSTRPAAAAELGFVRAVARADASVGRIVDGHLNGVERLAVQAPEELRDGELALVRAGALRVGVWGGDPRPGEGQPAAIGRRGADEVLTGVKTFCSGAGGLERALVLARDPEASAPVSVSVWVDLTDRRSVTVDPAWYRSSGLRASVSHRVVFDGAPILARFGPPGAISAQPWFGRDALRTAASWAGMADAAFDAALDDLRSRPEPGQAVELAVGRMVTAQRTIESWLGTAARAMDAAAPDLADVALHARAAIAAAARTLLDEAARACGSHPFATGGDLDRARRDLELFLLQHRLDPGLAAAGARALVAPKEVSP